MQNDEFSTLNSSFENSKKGQKTLARRKKKRKTFFKRQKVFKYRNLIKKIKTHCIKVYEKALKKCLVNPTMLSFYNIKSTKSRTLFRYFKSDISKEKNIILLQSPLKSLLTEFLGKEKLEKLNVKVHKRNLFNFLLNLRWKEFIVFIKNRNREIFNDEKEVSNNYLLSRENVNIFLDYIYRTNIKKGADKKEGTENNYYKEFISKLTLEQGTQKNINNQYINNEFSGYLCNFKNF